MATDKIDVVYVLGTGSKWNNNEIRFSLRSLEKNLHDYRNIYVVGHHPDFLKNIIHVPAKDIFNPDLNADGNIITKVLLACRQKDLSDDFLFINDDHLVIKPVRASDIPPFHKGDMTKFSSIYWNLNFWRKRLKRTMNVLLQNDLPVYHFDCHTPIIFNKKRFPEIMQMFNYQDNIGYTMKSLYANIICSKDHPLTNEKKTVFRYFNLQQLNDRLKTPYLMSFNDQGLNFSLKWWLISNFPERSKFEKNDPSDMILDLFFWDSTGRNYKKGVKIFENYYRHTNLIRLLKTRETNTLRKKLEFKLLRIINEL